MTGTDSTPLDAKLGALADNSGPTPTHALLAGSPAIDAGDTAPATDQRGFSRSQGSGNDIGAFEVQLTNTAPTATDAAVSTPEDTATTIILSGSDEDAGDTLTFKITALPTNGTLQSDEDGEGGNAPVAIASDDLPFIVPANNTVIYTPNPDFHGADEFKFTAHDGTVESGEATITLTVSAVNDAPNVINTIDDVTANEDDADATKNLALVFADVDGDEVTYSVHDLAPEKYDSSSWSSPVK